MDGATTFPAKIMKMTYVFPLLLAEFTVIEHGEATILQKELTGLMRGHLFKKTSR